MKTIKLFGFAFAAMVSVTALADFSFNAGYSWRTPMKTSFKGQVREVRPQGGDYLDGRVNLGEMADDGCPDWEGGTFGSIQNTTVPAENDYTLILNRDDSVVSGGSDEDSTHGLTMAVGYDFYDNEVIAIGATLRFAGYWGLKNSTPGGYMVYNDTYRFTGLLDDGINPKPDRANYDEPDAYEGRDYLLGGPGGRVSLKSDLYQIGLGPKVTWHALSFLDVYGGVEALCCFVNSDLDAGGAAKSEVSNLWGVGGHLGLAGYVTDNIGFFGQVGYEWVDEDEIRVKGISAKTDYSSLVLSAGLLYRF